MTVDAILGLQSRLYYSTTSNTGPWNELSDLSEMDGADDPKVDKIEATPLNPTGNAKEYLFGLIEYGEFGFKQYYKKTRLTALRALLGTNPAYWKIVVPDNPNSALASYMVVTGTLISAKTGPFQKGNPILIDCKVTITGPSTFTQGS